MAADSGIIRGGLGQQAHQGSMGQQPPGQASQGISSRRIALTMEAYDGTDTSPKATTSISIPIPQVSLRVGKMLALELAMKGMKAWLADGLKAIGAK